MDLLPPPTVEVASSQLAIAKSKLIIQSLAFGLDSANFGMIDVGDLKINLSRLNYCFNYC